jgi:hypothetical protein
MSNAVIQELYDLVKKRGKKDRESKYHRSDCGNYGSRKEFDFWTWERNGYRVRADKEKSTSWNRTSDNYSNYLNLKVFKGEKLVFSANLDKGGYSDRFSPSSSFSSFGESYQGKESRKPDPEWKIWTGANKLRTLRNLMRQKVAGYYRGETWVEGYSRAV